MYVRLLTLTLDDGRIIRTHVPDFCEDNEKLVLESINISERLELQDCVKFGNINEIIKTK